MPSIYSITSTSGQGTSSGGASQLLCIPDWDLPPFDDIWGTLQAGRTATIAWCDHPSGALIAHLVRLEQQKTEGAYEFYRSSIRNRVLCHFLVSNLPNEALPELYETLGDLYSFYAIQPSKRALPSPTSQKFVAKEGKAYLRPSIRVDEE